MIEKLLFWILNKLGYGYLLPNVQCVIIHKQMEFTDLHSSLFSWRGDHKQMHEVRRHLLHLMEPQILKLLRVDKRNSDKNNTVEYLATLYIGKEPK